MDIKQLLYDIFLTKIAIGDFNFSFHLTGLLLRLVLPLIAIFIVFKYIKKGISHFVNKSKAKDENKNTAKKWVRRVFNIIYFIITAIFLSNLLGADTLRYLRMLYEILNQPIIESSGTRITIITVILTIPVFYLASWAGKSVKKLINHDLLDKIGFDESRKFGFTSLVQYAVMVVIVLIGLSFIGIDLSALTLIFGVLGIGLGFGLQHTIANFIAGLQIIFSRPVKEGDRILVNGIEGTVSQIRLNSTSITTMMNESIIIPNSNLVQNVVHNYSYEDRKIVISNPVQISYDDDPEKVLGLLLTIGRENPFSMGFPEPKARLKGFGDSGIDLCLYTWISDVEYKYDARDWTNRAIWKSFQKNEVTIPFPHIQLKTDVKTKEAEVQKEEEY
ncbi:MAG: mechanosensitive ion channel [Spirochaetales bacterium]|nr:mechanosensitive ion channel [Spirochaetales bacterium]